MYGIMLYFFRWVSDLFITLNITIELLFLDLINSNAGKVVFMYCKSIIYIQLLF